MTAKKTVPVGKTPGQKPAKAAPTKHKVPIKIEIVEPAPKQDFPIDNGAATTEPTMPKIKLKATVNVQGQEATIGTIRWEFSLTGKYHYRDTNQSYAQRAYDFPAGNVETAPGEEKEFTLAPELVVGGTLVVKASYTGGAEVGGATVTQTVEGLRVTGPSLPRKESTAYIIQETGALAWLFLRMFAVETEANPYQQFKSGMPWYGFPAGVGVGQRDVEPERWKKVFAKEKGTTTIAPNQYFPKIFWNWKRCVDESVSFFNSEKLPMGKADIAALRAKNPNLPDPPDGITYRAGIRRYNGGHEYDSSDGTHYQTPMSSTEYSAKVVNKDVPEAKPYPVPPEALADSWPPATQPPANVPIPRPRPAGI